MSCHNVKSQSLTYWCRPYSLSCTGQGTSHARRRSVRAPILWRARGLGHAGCPRRPRKSTDLPQTAHCGMHNAAHASRDDHPYKSVGGGAFGHRAVTARASRRPLHPRRRAANAGFPQNAPGGGTDAGHERFAAAPGSDTGDSKRGMPRDRGEGGDDLRRARSRGSKGTSGRLRGARGLSIDARARGGIKGSPGR